MAEHAEERTRWENGLTAAIWLLFRDESTLLRYRPYDEDRFAAKLLPEIEPRLQRMYGRVQNKLYDQVGLPRPERLPKAPWVQKYAKTLVRDLSRNIGRDLDSLHDESTAADVRSIFSKARAQRIGVSDTTQAISKGELDAGDDIGDKLGMVAVTIWRTEKFGVCKVCRALNRTRREIWGIEYPDGPPAHRWCRCWLEFDFVTPRRNRR